MKKVIVGILIFFFIVAAFQPGGWQEQYLTTATFDTNGVFNRTNHVGLQPRSSIYDFDLGVGIYLTNTRHPIFTVDNLRLDANTITTTNGNLTLQSASGAVILNGSAVTNFGLLFNDLESFFNADMHLLGGAFFDFNNGSITELGTLNVESIAAFNSSVLTLSSPVDFNNSAFFNGAVTNNSTSYFGDRAFFSGGTFSTSDFHFDTGANIFMSNSAIFDVSTININQTLNVGGNAYLSNLDLASNVIAFYMPSNGNFRIGNQRILTNRQPAIADPTALNFLTVLSNVVIAMRAHGLIEP